MKLEGLRYNLQKPDFVSVIVTIVLAQFVIANLVSEPASYGVSVIFSTLIYLVYQSAHPIRE